MRGGILEEIPEGLELFLLFFCHFVGPELDAHLYWGLKKISCRACLIFCFFLTIKSSFFKKNYLRDEWFSLALGCDKNLENFTRGSISKVSTFDFFDLQMHFLVI